jgi:(2Fe-2S) ferredoxin
MEALSRTLSRRSGSGWLPVDSRGMQLVQRQRLVRAQAAPQLRPQRMAAGAPVAGLHKERKKLAKALKAHRKRLDELVNGAVDAPERVVLADLVQELERLHAVLGAAPAPRSQPAPAECCAECGHGGLAAAAAMADGGDSSSSDSDAEEVVADSCIEMDASKCRAASSSAGRGGGGPLLVHTMGRTIELQPPQLEPPGAGPPAGHYQGEGSVAVCQGSKCQRQGSLAVLQQVSQLAGCGLQVLPCKCLGRCGSAPAVRVKVEGRPCAVYTQVTPAAAGFVLERHFEGQGQGQGQRGAAAQGGERLAS